MKANPANKQVEKADNPLRTDNLPVSRKILKASSGVPDAKDEERVFVFHFVIKFAFF